MMQWHFAALRGCERFFAPLRRRFGKFNVHVSLAFVLMTAAGAGLSYPRKEMSERSE